MLKDVYTDVRSGALSHTSSTEKQQYFFGKSALSVKKNNWQMQIPRDGA